MIAIELAFFTFALLAIWWIRRQQLRSLNQQHILLRRFAEAVTAWRGKPGIPIDARQAIELLVDMPISRAVLRRYALKVLSPQVPSTLDENPFWLARTQLEPEQREAFDWLVINFLLAFTYSDWITGPLIRRMRLGGLSRQTQAEIALETVSSRVMGQAVHAAA